MLKKAAQILRSFSSNRRGVKSLTQGPMSLKERKVASGNVDYPRHNYDDEDAARRALEIVDDFTMTSYERMITLWQQVRYLDRARIPGALVECGTWRGGACGMMALAHIASGTPWREIHLFDSFEGLPEPDACKDTGLGSKYAQVRATGALKSIGIAVGSLEDNQHLMHELIGYPRELTFYHVGWFQDTVPIASKDIGQIALLRLDGDWYESTRICLEGLCIHVSSGGIIVIDDYGHFAGCRKAVDEFLNKMKRPLFLNHIDGTGRYLIVP